MKVKILHILIIITSLFGYLEWGGNNHAFLFEVEAELFSKICINPSSIIHPFTVIPLIGQFMLILTLFQKKPNKILTFVGIASIGMLLVFMLVIGLISLHVKIILFTLPFIVVSIVTIRQHVIIGKKP